MNQPLLSIIIPTFRRPVELGTQLGSILPQLVELPTGTVEVFVVDNGLDAETPGVIKELQAQCDSLRYFRRAASVPLEVSIMSAREFGSGEYLWTLGDDDAIHAGCVAGIVGHIRNQRPSIALLSVESWDSDLQRCMGRGHQFLKDPVNLFESLPDAVRTLGWGVYFAYPGTAVVKAEPFRAADIDAYSTSAHIYSFALLEAFWNERCAFLRFPAIKYRVSRTLPWSENKLYGVTTTFVRCFDTAIRRGFGDWQTFLAFRECIAADHKLLYLKVHSLAACMLSNLYDCLRAGLEITATDWLLFEQAYQGYGDPQMIQALAMIHLAEGNIERNAADVNRSLAAILIRENLSTDKFPPDFSVKGSIDN